MTDTTQNNRPNVGENIRYLGEMVEKMMDETDKTVPENANGHPVIQITGNNNIISTDNSNIVVVKERSKKLLSLLAAAFLFF